MTTQEKIELGFDNRQIPETKQGKIELKNPYAKRYKANKINIVVVDEVTKKMRDIKNKRNLKSDSDTIKYLCDLEIAVDPKFNTTFKCNGCNEEIKNVPENINIKRFVHNDLCITTSCKGHIARSKEIALDDKGLVISNKDKASGANESNDKNRMQTELKDTVTKSRITPKGKVETIGDWEYLDGKKVMTYLGNDPDNPMTQDELDAI